MASKNKGKKQKSKKATSNLDEDLKPQATKDRYQRSLWETLTKSKTMRVYNANKTVATNKNASMLNKAKIKQGILSAAAVHLQNSGNKLEFEIKDLSHLPATLEVLDDLKDRYNIQHGTEDPKVPEDMRNRVVILSLKDVDMFGVM